MEMGWSDDFKKFLKHNHVHYKEDSNSDLVVLFNDYNDLYQSKVNQYLRSVVISRNSKRFVSYSCATPYENLDGLDYMFRNNTEEPEITECYEGTFMSLFNYEDKWYLSTRKCLDARESKYKETSYYDMFCEVLSLDGYTFDSFCDKLDKNYGYYFILLDSRNVNIVDYSYLFGENYKKLMFMYNRDEEQKVVNKFDLLSENIIPCKKIDHISYLDNYNKVNKWNLPAKSEGIVLRYKDESLIKLQSLDYKFAKSVGPDENILYGLLKMYQLDKLTEYIETNKNNEKIVNPNNSNETFHTVGIINSVFRTLTTELYNLYNLLYNKDGSPNDGELYKIIPNEYKYFMFKLRGINFKKNSYSKNLTEKDVYFLLKNIDIEKIVNVLRMRKLMTNLLFQNSNDNLTKFKTITNNVDKLNYKLVSIFTAKMFPELMDKDLPENVNLSL